MADALFNDILYNDVLTTDGFVVDYAVGTTYGMDVPTLLSVPFMLGAMGELTADAMRSPHYILEAINRSARKFAVFCNAGCISVPDNIKTNIVSLLEQSVVQIALGNQGHGFVNFHPKVWVIKESSPDNQTSRIKVIVMSRNLSSSNNLDVVCELTGAVGNKQSSAAAKEKHKPLVDFLQWLKGKANGRHIRGHIDDLCESINLVERFALDGSPFEDYHFYPMGIPDYNGKETCLDSVMLDHSAETVIISPFVDDATIERFTKERAKCKRTLITRHASVTQKMLDAMNDGVYAVKEVMTDKSDKAVAVDIHEKVYFIRNCQTNINQLFLGSTNATQNGFGRNVEFLLALDFGPYKTGYDSFRREHINDAKDCLFEKVESVGESANEKVDYTQQHTLRQAISSIKRAVITPRENEKYDVCIELSKRCAFDCPVYLHPLYSPTRKMELANDMVFEGLALTELTEFYVISADEAIRSVIKIDTPSMPRDVRDKAIFRSVINTKAKFINYLAFMLAESAEAFIAENKQLEMEHFVQGKALADTEISTSLFEDMVRTAYSDPERIKSIRGIIEKADKDVIPANFDHMYAQFEKVIAQIKRL